MDEFKLVSILSERSLIWKRTHMGGYVFTLRKIVITATVSPLDRFAKAWFNYMCKTVRYGIWQLEPRCHRVVSTYGTTQYTHCVRPLVLGLSGPRLHLKRASSTSYFFSTSLNDFSKCMPEESHVPVK